MEDAHGQPQLESDYFEKTIYCDVCGRWFDDEREITKHKIIHDKTEISLRSSLNYNFCDKIFDKRELMNKHHEKVSVCRKAISRSCEYGEHICWFSHTKISSNVNFESFKCQTCDNNFLSQGDLLYYKKRMQKELVPLCRYYQNNFGDLICWFNHTKQLDLDI